ncbi:hypothetical protein DFJ77DRAFT_33617 [Powellomyces hirtus]|nr:hypothetical protein DFJ77DRAFT_33617 [Powellomyces hirtus]
MQPSSEKPPHSMNDFSSVTPPPKKGILTVVQRLFSAVAVKNKKTPDQQQDKRRLSAVEPSPGERRSRTSIKDRLRRFSAGADGADRRFSLPTDNSEKVAESGGEIDSTTSHSRNAISLPDTLQSQSRQASACSDVDGAGPLAEGCGSGNTLTGRVSRTDLGGLSRSRSYVDQPDSSYIMTPGGVVSVSDARESLGNHSPRSQSLTPNATDESKQSEAPTTHEIMVGGEMRTATIDELTTLMAFGVVLPTMMDFRKIGLAGGGSTTSVAAAPRNSTTTPVPPTHNVTRRRNSLPAKAPQPVLPPSPLSTQPVVVGQPAKRSRRNSLPGPPRPSVTTAAGSQEDSASSSRRNSGLSSGVTDSCRDIARELPDFERQLNLRMTPAIFLAGEYIIRKREVGQEMYFLSKGKVEVVSSDGKTVYSSIGPGSFFGELGVLFDIPRTASVRTLTNSFCMVLSRTDLQEVMREFPSISERFEKVVAARMAEVRSRRDSAVLSRVRIQAAFNTIEEEDE